jgi:uncharacterized protein YlxP (DUF503 family)
MLFLTSCIQLKSKQFLIHPVLSCSQSKFSFSIRESINPHKNKELSNSYISKFYSSVSDMKTKYSVNTCKHGKKNEPALNF